MPKLGETRWDSALARTLYDAGLTFVQIGARVGVEPGLVWQFGARHDWPPRVPRRYKRNPRLGRFLPGEPTLPPLRCLMD